jgi:DnaJ-class molecular chaperone
MKEAEIRALARILDSLDYYRLLRVERGVPGGEIRAAYHRVLREFHPDQFLGSPPELRAAVEEIARRITEAYTVLRHTQRRAAYDRGLEEGGLRYDAEAEETGRGSPEQRGGKTPNGRRFWGMVLDAERKGDLRQAISHLKMALTFEAKNEHFKQKLEELQAAAKRS